MTAQHRMRGDVAVLVPAAGLGLRLGPGGPKALRELAGEALLVHAVRRVVAAPCVGCVVVAAPPDAVDAVAELLSRFGARPRSASASESPLPSASDPPPPGAADPAAGEAGPKPPPPGAAADPAAGEAAPDEAAVIVAAAGASRPAPESPLPGATVGPAAGEAAPDEAAVIVVAGGATRQASVSAALAAVPGAYDIVLVHDAARALTPPSLVERVADAIRAGQGAVIPVLAVVDTVKQVDAGGVVLGTVDRSELRAVQTPQGFRREVLVAAHAAAVDDLTDDAGLAEKLGVAVQTVPGDEAALKITRPLDLALAEILLARGA